MGNHNQSSTKCIASFTSESYNYLNIKPLDIAINLDNLLKTLHHIEAVKDQNLLPHVAGMLAIATRECSALVDLLDAGELSQ